MNSNDYCSHHLLLLLVVKVGMKVDVVFLFLTTGRPPEFRFLFVQPAVGGGLPTNQLVH